MAAVASGHGQMFYHSNYAIIFVALDLCALVIKDCETRSMIRLNMIGNPEF